MRKQTYRTDLPILMLYDVDPAWPQEDICDVQDEVQLLIDALKAVGHPVTRVRVETADITAILQQYDPEEAIVFNCCEEIPGIPHNCALAAEILEMLGFTFTGASADALTLGQDKRQIKRCLEKAGIPTPNWEVFNSIDYITWDRFPAIVKPALEHCSYGITRDAVVQTPSELSQRVGFVLDELRQPAIVEDFIDGREFHIGVFGNGRLRLLPPGEIDYSGFNDIHDRLCTYEANFDKASLAYHLTMPRMSCNLSRTELHIINQIATQAYLATGCRDYARMDIRMQNDIFFVLDVNHNPDIGPETSMILGAGKLGYSYGQFGSLLVNLAAHRHQVHKV
jgi:D-alanine-D-alanine ligase